jgi:hypothetical protein
VWQPQTDGVYISTGNYYKNILQIKKDTDMRINFALLLALWSLSLFAQTDKIISTGFFVTDSGHIITNNHMLDDYHHIRILVGDTEHKATLLRSDMILDLALLKIEHRNRHHFTLADVSAISLGERVQTLGYMYPNHLGLGMLYADGMVVSKSGLLHDHTHFIHNIPAPVGSYGSPIFNERFAVVGTTTLAQYNIQFFRPEFFIDYLDQSWGFALHSSELSKFLGNIRVGRGNVRSIQDAESATATIHIYQNDVYIMVANNIGTSIVELYISSSSHDFWGVELLRGEVMPCQSTMSVRIPNAYRYSEHYDFRFHDDRGNIYFKSDVNIMDSAIIEFERSDISRHQMELPVIQLVNDTGNPLNSVYFARNSDQGWGGNILSESLIESGDYMLFYLNSPLDENFLYNIRVVDSDGNVYQKLTVTIMHDMEIVFSNVDMIVYEHDYEDYH